MGYHKTFSLPIDKHNGVFTFVVTNTSPEGGYESLALRSRVYDDWLHVLNTDAPIDGGVYYKQHGIDALVVTSTEQGFFPAIPL